MFHICEHDSFLRSSAHFTGTRTYANPAQNRGENRLYRGHRAHDTSTHNRIYFITKKEACQVFFVKLWFFLKKTLIFKKYDVFCAAARPPRFIYVFFPTHMHPCPQRHERHRQAGAKRAAYFFLSCFFSIFLDKMVMFGYNKVRTGIQPVGCMHRFVPPMLFSLIDNTGGTWNFREPSFYMKN